MNPKYLYRGLFALSVASLIAVPALHAGAKPTSEVGRREENQQDRIANGVKTGELTPAEVARLEIRETALREQIKDDRSADGGKLTPVERVQINRELDRLSQAIYRAKHNHQTVPHGSP